MDKLNIQDLSKLKITTVKQWCVNFKYDGEQYFLHDDSDEDRCLGLYHKINNGQNDRIDGKITLDSPMDYIKMKSGIKYKWNDFDGKCNVVYNQIDLEYFVKKLTYDEFIDSCLESECNRIKKLIEINNKHIKKLQEQIDKLKKMNIDLMR